jgi:hypothetical protein
MLGKGMRAAALAGLGVTLAGCPVNMGWDVDQGNAAEADLEVTALPFFVLDVDHGDDADASGVFALHSESRFYVENPHDRWRARNGQVSVEPESAATITDTSPAGNVLSFTARFEEEGPVELQVRRAIGWMLDKRTIEVAKATEKTRLRRYTQAIFAPDAPDLGDAIHVAEGGTVGVLVDWRDAQERPLLGRDLLRLRVAPEDRDAVTVRGRAKDGGTEGTWGDWFDLEAGVPTDHDGVVELSAGPDLVRSVAVRVHAIEELDAVSVTEISGVHATGQDLGPARWLLGEASELTQPVLAAPLQWYMDGHWVGEGSFAGLATNLGDAHDVIVCAQRSPISDGDPILDEGALDTDVADTDVADTDVVALTDTDPADTDAADTDASSDTGTDALGASTPARGADGSPCVVTQVYGRILAVHDDRVDFPPMIRCGCDSAGSGASAVGLLALAMLRRRRPTAR